MLGLASTPAAVALLYQALPTASSAYIQARQLGGDAPLMAGIIAAQTLLAAATVPLALGLLAPLERRPYSSAGRRRRPRRAALRPAVPRPPEPGVVARLRHAKTFGQAAVEQAGALEFIEAGQIGNLLQPEMEPRNFSVVP